MNSLGRQNRMIHQVSGFLGLGVQGIVMLQLSGVWVRVRGRSKGLINIGLEFRRFVSRI